MAGVDKAVGEVDWGDVEVNTGGGSARFVSLKDQGDHRMRLFTKPFQYFSTWVKDDSGKDVKISCEFKPACRYCRPRMEKDNPSARWYCLVLDRDDDDKIKVLDFGPQIFQGIKSLVEDPDWGDVKKYDIKIHRGPKNSNPLYTVKPCAPSKFVSEEKTAMRAALTPNSETFVDLAKMCEPTSCEETHRLLTGATAIADKKSDDESFGFGANDGKADTAFLDDDDDKLDDFDESQRSPAEGDMPKTASLVTEDEDDDDDDFLDLS